MFSTGIIHYNPLEIIHALLEENMKINPVFVYIIALALILTACSEGQIAVSTDIPSPEPVETRAIVLGDISDDPAEVIDGTQPLADYLASQLTDYGITEGQVRVASS